MENNFKRRRYIRIISFFVSLSVLFGVWAAISTVKVQKYKLLASASTERALSELCENLDNITTVLEKGMYCTSNTMLSNVSSQLGRSAACAKVSLGQLTDETMVTDEVYKFLSQVGDFTNALVTKAEAGQALTAKEKESVKLLYEYSKSLSDSMDEIRNGYYDGSITFEKGLSNLSLDTSDEASLFSNSVSDAEQSLADYPTLIYDGPFADSVLERESELIKGKNEITAAEAKKLAAKYLKADESSIRQDDDEISSIPLYCFSVGEKSVGITKSGGYLCYMTNPDYSSEATISEEEAADRAEKYLDSIGYDSMEKSYYSDYDGVCTVNFAYEDDNDIIYYADLIKVSVALDSGEVVAVDARGYITNHRNRTLPEEKISLAEAKKTLSSELTLLESEKTLIPTDSGKEKLCWEFHCRNSENQEYLIYTDVETGEEADILILLYADGGTVVR